ncbi:hypothetical protein CG478_014610 [Bacillus cytotoxicus]|nr:hypothetical protein CG483_014610 [Bacillus cytotoxicus]AWC33451.1 hypothetical protein CG482_014370 [Bacillus cytotoxicus]AWC37429.1 hypothetical protein CG481_014145 [Bacillus cytotoxicus]AWC41569.1 hypothetical protein CG480_014610 [Bacillus cytotoxicus]AWC45413.1 hypothetical protein CG479_013560 [Bacillus cytotoxicus]
MCERTFEKRVQVYPKYFKPLPSQPHGAVLKDHYLTVVSIAVFIHFVNTISVKYLMFPRI